ncbi:MAG: leucine-rich repeat domain-containing protein [Defluviitaleaceae bacterium]|nr:leucine-rich repeat domain-containing protein [Defluviitaleaceae bacterium]
MYCKKCGNQLSATAVFCGSCGNPTNKGNTTPPVCRTGRQKKPPVKLIIAGISATAIIAAVAVVMVFFPFWEDTATPVVLAEEPLLLAEVEENGESGESENIEETAALPNLANPAEETGNISELERQFPGLTAGMAAAYLSVLEGIIAEVGILPKNFNSWEDMGFGYARLVDFEGNGSPYLAVTFLGETSWGVVPTFSLYAYNNGLIQLENMEITGGTGGLFPSIVATASEPLLLTTFSGMGILQGATYYRFVNHERVRVADLSIIDAGVEFLDHSNPEWADDEFAWHIDMVRVSEEEYNAALAALGIIREETVLDLLEQSTPTAMQQFMDDLRNIAGETAAAMPPAATPPAYITIAGQQISTAETSITFSEGLNPLHANLTNADIVDLRYMTNLTYILIRGTQITDLTPISGLTNLESLIVQWGLVSDLTPLANLTNLTQLFLQDNQISDIAPIANLPNLEGLGLWGNPVADWSLVDHVENVWGREALYLTTANLHLRQSPSTDAESLGLFPPDTAVWLDEQAYPETEWFWVKIGYGNDRIWGFMHSDFLTPWQP